MGWISLNHVLNESTPMYGNATGFKRSVVRDFVYGDLSRNSDLSFPAHIGTHVDAPAHFDEKGMYLEEFESEFWVCRNIKLLDIPVSEGFIFTVENLKSHMENIPGDTEMLLFRTGFEKIRLNNTDRYIKKNPGFHPDVGIWLRKNMNLKFIGFDFISLTSYTNRELGRLAHRAFLSLMPDGESDSPGNPILILEDMSLQNIVKPLEQVIVAPLMFSRADGSPVTVYAREEE